MRPRISLPVRTRATSLHGAPTWRQRRDERALYRQIARRPRNVRNELLEMLSRA